MATRATGMAIAYLAWNAANNAGATGDASNHTLRWIKDGTAAAPTNSPLEVDATYAPGVYRIDLTATETDCNIGVLAGRSSTSGVTIVPVLIQFERLPDATPGTANGVPRVSDIPAASWSYGNRTLTDKTGFSLTSAYDAAKTAAQPGDEMRLTSEYNALKSVTEGMEITQDTVGTDGKPLGRVMPGGIITAYPSTAPDTPWDSFVADADGDYSFKLPYGSVWRLVARPSAGRYKTTEAEVSTVV